MPDQPELRIFGGWPDVMMAEDLTAADGPAWVVLWMGVIHGGRHYDPQAVVAHAKRLHEAPEWDRAEWRRMHGLTASAARTPEWARPAKVLERVAR